MTVLELLAATARAWVVATNGFLHADWFAFGILACIALCRSLLVGIVQVNFCLVVTLLLFVAFGVGSNFYIAVLLHRYLSAHQYRYGLVVDFAYHLVEQCYRLELEYQQRVFLLVACILYRVLEFIEVAQVLFPCVVDGVEQN